MVVEDAILVVQLEEKWVVVWDICQSQCRRKGLFNAGTPAIVEAVNGNILVHKCIVWKRR
jgi:hypothetical protein